MPALSPTMTEGNLAKWCVEEGDEVHPGDVVAEIETDKATMEVESIDEGVIGKILVPEGAEGVAVNATIALLLEDGEDASNIHDQAEEDGVDKLPGSVANSREPQGFSGSASFATELQGADVKVSPLAKRIAEHTGLDLGSIVGSGAHGKILKADVEGALADGGKLARGHGDISAEGALSTIPIEADRIFASPLARRMAIDANVDLENIPGTGPGGRIVRSDLEDIAKIEQPSAERKTSLTGGVLGGAEDKSKIVKLTTMRKAIARRMVESKSEVPHFYLTMDCEIDELLKVRKSLNGAQSDVKISVNDFVIRACALALIEVPSANVAYEGEGDMRQFHTSDISVAVAISGGLITPILHAAEKKGFKQIAAEMKELASRAREGKLMPKEYEGGSFSISNLGMFGVKHFYAVINPPQAAILAVGAGEQRPIVKNGEIVSATVMTCTLSVDHRVVDGAIGAELLAAIKRRLENPALMLL